jgi:hypothetical protein
MGGVGKTAICRELAHHATNPAHIVIWKQVTVTPLFCINSNDLTGI